MSSQTDRIDPQQLAFDVRSTIGELARRLRDEESALPQPQAAALGLLVREGSRTTAELAEHQHVRHQSMARTVTQLREAGLIRQEPHPTDGRKVVLHATEEGIAMLQEQRRRREDRMAAAIESEMSEAEQLVLRQAMALLRRISRYPRP
ncbi:MULTISPECIES: MarR family winged helix-turn-helix transcriptional regulator [Kitasatospora]|uniref:MarR family winged helix-turn-helix transcriptional regulator n=1 Tax=Kitasatospora TaxID=2063 RepID=UPI000C6FD5EF|nr:MarR family transcriptional regulator [Kitasatospora sp. GP30]MDH6139600.1 DNA-binding MarR family transcriptional regulator [Kitasatospora sp. GP30]